MSTETTISETAFQQYQDVQESGMTNMVMQRQVREVAEAMGHTELLTVIDNGDYTEILENYEELAAQYT